LVEIVLVLFVLIVAILVSRGLGFAGVHALASWHAAARYGLAVMLLFTSSAHFTAMKEDLIRMTPSWVPRPREMVFFTGLCEIAGAIGLAIPMLQRAAGIALILFFLAVLPANVHAAQAQVILRGRPATPLWLRVPMQILFIGLAWWSTR
jgi:uncharacterized membrane protein